MSRAGWVVALGVLVLFACTIERTSLDKDTASSHSRSDTGVSRLPSDPSSLALALGVPVDSLRAAGEERYGREEFDSAQAIMRVEVTRARAAADTPAEARARMWIGLAAYHLGDYKTARQEGGVSLAMKRSLGLDSEMSRSFNALGLVAWQEGRSRDALANFDSAIGSAKRNDDAAGVARATVNIPLVQVDRGDFEGARRGLEAALAAGKATRDEKVQGNALANLAMLEIRLGRPSLALPLLARARKHYRPIKYEQGEANALGQLATAWSQLGDLQRAIASADTALSLARAEGLEQEVAAELEVIADLDVQAGSPRLGLRSLFEADSIDAAIGLILERGINLRRMAAILSDLGEASASVARAREALAVHNKVEALDEIVYDRIQLARSLSVASNHAEARAELDTAVDAGSGSPGAVRDLASTAAQLALDAKDPRRALEYLGRVKEDRGGAFWQVDDLRAQALFALIRFDEARIAGERAVAGLERERASLALGPLRSGFLQSRAAPFSHLLAIHLARGDTAAAFGVAASLGGRSITERLGGFVQTGKSMERIAEGERILLRVAALEQEIGELGYALRDEKRRAPLNQALETARAAYEEELSREGRSPGARVGIVAPSLLAVQSRLANDEALVDFVSGPDRLDVFVVRRGVIDHHSVPIGDRALALRVRVARELLGQAHPGSPVPSALGELYDSFFAEAVGHGALDGATRLLVTPHASLGALPFAALWNRRSGRFLVEERVVSYLPSVAALSAEPGETRPPLERMTVFVPIPDSLPGTRREAEAIAQIIPGAAIRLGTSSTETAVRAALESGRTVHLASHGMHNAQNPLFSRMTVGRAVGVAPENDGKLEVHEILSIITRSPLVFLSGCETGLVSGAEGQIMQGSDESSLAQAFLIAGAQSVVATLWRVDDASAVRVADSFYLQLRNGLSPEEALASAQRDAIRRRGDYTWAAYTVSGRGKDHRKFPVPVRRTLKDE
ncbi:MAG: CHAT domain-containing protein [Gemmatimonadaceae bacterium]